MKLKEILYSFSGGDYRIIAQCDPALKQQFLRAGLFVPLLFILCFLSNAFIFSSLFTNYILIAALALFFSWMIANIYRLMLYTLARNTLPHASAIRSVMSTGIRITFICFIALFVSKPIESILYARLLDHEISAYKTESKKTNAIKILFYYQQQVNEVKRISADAAYLQKFTRQKELERATVIRTMYHLVESSDYYLQRIKFLNTRNYSCWLVTVLLMLFFNLPVYYLKCMKDNDYYAMKRSMEIQMVTERYSVFKSDFALVLKEKYNEDIVYCEPYSDAPFNTMKKDRHHFFNQEHLLSEVYDAGT